MIAPARAWVRRHWPRLRLRTLVFATLFLVAALPGFGAVFLRVYENTLVRQTEAELVAQGAALAAAAAADWPPAPPPDPVDPLSSAPSRRASTSTAPPSCPSGRRPRPPPSPAPRLRRRPPAGSRR